MSALELPAAIAGSVDLLKFSEALARARPGGAPRPCARGVLVIEPATPPVQRCPACRGTGLDEDARCEFCRGTGRAGA